ncbi:unnamed protein product [Auanema sp. JU1783]|nr:unnamed protein product [Auanema sp. JU1783]
MVDDIFVHKMPFHHTWLIWWNFQYFGETMLVWTILSLTTYVPFKALEVWSKLPASRQQVQAQGYCLLAAYTVYFVAFFYFPLKFLFSWELKCACSFIITCETTRIAMKLHSFIRENYPRVADAKMKLNEHKENEFVFPSISQFVYFQFCPSFLYRDEYPRSETRSWKTVAFYFAQCFLVIEYVNLAFTQYVQPWLSDLNMEYISITEGFLTLFAAILPGIICLLSLFYGLLHCWLNAFSEMMMFADRQFYLNWWCSDNMAEYYRNWNLVVHDWLYAYVYKDVSMLIGGRRGLRVAQMCVFFLSAIFHEYWFGVAFRVFYPVMFMLYFVFGGTFFSVSRLIKSKAAWNTALWFNLLIGTGMFVAFYGQEWYARETCLPYSGTISDFMLPRHWICEYAE